MYTPCLRHVTDRMITPPIPAPAHTRSSRTASSIPQGAQSCLGHAPNAIPAVRISSLLLVAVSRWSGEPSEPSLVRQRQEKGCAYSTLVSGPMRSWIDVSRCPGCDNLTERPFVAFLLCRSRVRHLKCTQSVRFQSMSGRSSKMLTKSHNPNHVAGLSIFRYPEPRGCLQSRSFADLELLEYIREIALHILFDISLEASPYTPCHKRVEQKTPGAVCEVESVEGVPGEELKEDACG